MSDAWMFSPVRLGPVLIVVRTQGVISLHRRHRPDRRPQLPTAGGCRAVPVDHKERAFESAIEHHLITAAGYTKAVQGFFDQVRALDATQFVPFIEDTQPDAWKKLEKLLGSRTEETLLDDFRKAMDSRGSLDVIQAWLRIFGEAVRVGAYFAPAHGMNPEVAALYAKNRLTVVRQLLFKLTSTKALDLTICLNGITIITAELKTP